MLLLAVVQQALAVVGGHGDDRAVVEARAAQARQQTTDELVRVGHFPVVGIGVLAVPLGRRVRRVRLVEVEEREEAARALGLGEARDGFGRDGAVPLQIADRLGPRLRLEGVVPGGEAVGDAGGPPQHEGRHGAGGRIARGLEAVRECPVLRVQREADVVAHAVRRREQAREERRVGGERHRAMAERALEQHSLAGERVEHGRRGLRVAVTAHAVGPQGVDRDQDDRSVLEGAGRGRASRNEHAGKERESESLGGGTQGGQSGLRSRHSTSCSGRSDDSTR